MLVPWAWMMMILSGPVYVCGRWNALIINSDQLNLIEYASMKKPCLIILDI